MLTTAQKVTLAAALRADLTPSVVAAVSIRNDTFLAEWCNTATSTDAWHWACSGRELFDASDVTKFDALTAGKRDAWRMMLDFGPHDLGKASNRKAIVDVWGAADSVVVLQQCRAKATNTQIYLGGTLRTTNTVAALQLNFTGNVTVTEVSEALNAPV